MLAKSWKQILLVICIIACIANITSKLVNKHSLKINLESVNDGNTVFNFKTDEETSSSDVIEGVVNPTDTTSDDTTYIVEQDNENNDANSNSSYITEEDQETVQNGSGETSETTREQDPRGIQFDFTDYEKLTPMHEEEEDGSVRYINF